MADDVFLLDSPAIEKAVMAHNTEVTRRRRFGKSSLNEIPEVSAGTKKDDYTGPFKIIRENETTIAVVNGSAPNFEYCGNTDLPGAENVAKTTFAFEGKEIRIYLHACHNNGVYSTVLAKRGETVAGSFDSRLIGIVYSNGTIQQTHFNSYQIVYRNDYYL